MDVIFDHTTLGTEHLRFLPPSLIGYLIRFGLWEYIMNVEAGKAWWKWRIGYGLESREFKFRQG
jgi:hypothetical protein